MNLSKVKVEVEHAKFYDYNLSEQDMYTADANLDPILKLVTPSNQLCQFYERYHRIVKPVQKLLKKNKTFVWWKEQEQDLDQLRAVILKPDVYLVVPRKDVPLILVTDGNDDGWANTVANLYDSYILFHSYDCSYMLIRHMITHMNWLYDHIS